MSSRKDAEKIMGKLGDAMKSGDVELVQHMLNKHVRSPNTDAKSYVHGVWQVARRYCTDKDYHHPILKVNQLGDWHCYRIDDPNP